MPSLEEQKLQPVETSRKRNLENISRRLMSFRIFYSEESISFTMSKRMDNLFNKILKITIIFSCNILQGHVVEQIGG